MSTLETWELARRFAAEGRQVDALRVCDEGLAQIHPSMPSAALAAAEVLWIKAGIYHDFGQSREELEVLQTLLDGAGDEQNGLFRKRVMLALGAKVRLLVDQDDGGNVSAAAKGLVTRVNEERESEVIAEVAQSVLGVAGTLRNAGYLDEGEALLAAVGARVEGEPDPRLARIRIEAQIARAASLVKLGRLDEALDLYELALRDGDEADAVFDELVREAPPGSDQWLVARLAQPVASLSAGRIDEAARLFDEVVAISEGETSEIAQRVSAMAKEARAALRDARP